MIPFRYEEAARRLRYEDAIRILMEFNPLHNDLDAYLFEVCEWAIGDVPLKPKRTDFGLDNPNTESTA